MLRPLFAAISRTFFRGLAVVLPVAITAYVLYWLVATAEASLGPLLRAVLPGVLYFPGLGVVAGLVLVFAVGILMRIWLLRQVITLFERLLEKLPLVKTLFGSVKDLMGLFGGSERRGLDQVVWVSLADGAAQVIGFVTRDDLDGLVAPEQAG
ncbi:MAG: DUF502 domain-containing protein, partial [Planctomycetes bacterium]|nr:DUF502 domain-containing protein [Planctomycetota bacterium]